MWYSYRLIYEILTPRERRRAALLFAMVLVMALFDVVGVTSVLPFVTALSNRESLIQNNFLLNLYELLSFSSFQVFQIFLGAVFISLISLSLVFKALTIYALLSFTYMRNFSLSKRLFEGYLRQPYEWFLNHHSADLSKGVLSEVDQAIQGAVVPAIQLLAQSVVALALILLLIIVDPFLALIVAIGLGFSFSFIFYILKQFLSRIGTQRTQANSSRYKVVQETFNIIKLIKLHALEKDFCRLFESPSLKFAKSQAAVQVVSRLPRYIFEIVAFVGILIVFAFLIHTTRGIGEVLPTLSLYALAGYRLMPALQEVFRQSSLLRYSKSGLERLQQDLMDANGSRHIENTTQTRFQGPFRSISLVDITFSYRGSKKPVLQNVNLDLPAQKLIGIFGRTGSGKSTLVDLVLGLLYPPKTGALLVDGKPVTLDNLRDWQRSLGYVPQSIHLMDKTIYENIAFGLPPEQIDMELVYEVARIACAEDFIRELPHHFESTVGEGGLRLSGGQRQRIGIARALYHKPEVLVLDEATSALDSATEKRVMDALRSLARSKTVLFIAHRKESLERCDVLVKVSQGTATFCQTGH